MDPNFHPILIIKQNLAALCHAVVAWAYAGSQ